MTDLTDLTRLVRLRQDDERMNLGAGDVLLVKPFWQDPTEKWEVLERVSDGFDPMCTVYRNQVEAYDGDDERGAGS